VIESRNMNDTATAAFRQAFHGEVITPGDTRYDAARVVWNGMIDRRPAMIARCTDVNDVMGAIRFGREHDLVVATRGGGHSVGGFSTCDAGIVIDLSGMRGAAADPEGRVARVNGGALLGELDHAAQAFGLACPVGVVGHTGVAGLTLGGGMGRLQRRFGLTIDNLLSVDLVTAEGELIHVSEEENGDLFWGIRGAGANFGVVTSFEFRLHPVGPLVTQGIAAYPVDRAADVAPIYRELLAEAPDELMLTMGFMFTSADPPFAQEMAGRPIITLGATHSGSPEDAEHDLRPIRNQAPLIDTFALKPYLAVQGMNDEALAWGKRFYMKGGYLAALTEEAITACIEQLTSAPGTHCEISLWSMGGAVGRVPDSAMAFTGREAPFWLGVEGFWDDPEDDEAFIAWGRTAMGALKPFTTAGHYVNDMVETGENVVRAIYGNDKYERLLALKLSYDPDNVFRLNQNIRP
jgi:FAD/FMN-containing dehydrogenase